MNKFPSFDELKKECAFIKKDYDEKTEERALSIISEVVAGIKDYLIRGYEEYSYQIIGYDDASADDYMVYDKVQELLKASGYKLKDSSGSRSYDPSILTFILD